MNSYNIFEFYQSRIWACKPEKKKKEKAYMGSKFLEFY